MTIDDKRPNQNQNPNRDKTADKQTNPHTVTSKGKNDGNTDSGYQKSRTTIDELDINNDDEDDVY